MKIKIVVVLTTLFCSSSSICQINDVEDQINYSKAGVYSNTNIDSLFHYAKKMQKSNDFCVSISGTVNIATAYYKYGNYDKSEEIALKALDNLKGKNTKCDRKNKYNALSRLFWIKNNQGKYNKAFNYLTDRIKIFDDFIERDDKYLLKKVSNQSNLALIKSNLGFHKESVKILKEIIENILKIKFKNNFFKNYNTKILKASIYNSLGDSYLGLHSDFTQLNYLDSSLIYYKKAYNIAKNISPEHKNSKTLYNLRRAKVLIRKKDYYEALKIVVSNDKNAEKLNTEQDLNFLKTLIYQNINEIDSSIYYSHKFLNYETTTPSTEKNKFVIYNTLANLYNQKNKIDRAYKYSNLTLKMLNELKKSKIEANKTHYFYNLNQIKKVNKSIIKKESKKRKQLIVLFLGIILFISILLYFLKKKKVIKDKVNKLKLPFKKEYSINKKIEEKVLIKLKAFEKSNNFLHSKFTIQVLAKNLNTNTSYLSSIINQKKGKTFKQYITELRITYLIKLLNSDAKFKKYTIKALGQEIGYTNASAFSRAFKNYNGITPSEFIKTIK